MSSIVNDKWQIIINRLKSELSLSDVAFNTWVMPIEIQSISDDVIILYAPNEIIRDYVNSRYLLHLRVIIAEECGKEYEISITSNKDELSTNEEPSNKTIKRPSITSTYTFDNFVVGANNAFAQSAALAVAENPLNSPYNPLFLYGGSGLGKTHLMYAIANYIKENNPSINVLYVTSEKFTNDVIEAIRTGKGGNVSAISNVRNKYRNVDVLLLDDIQFIIGKESTQEEFFHTFNDLYDANKAIIISSDKAPKNFEVLDERYTSRFESGLTADINSPDYETRMAILKKKIDVDQILISIPNDVLDYIATNVTTNIRELESCLTKVVAYSKLSNEPVSLDIAIKALNDIITKNENKIITPELVLDVVCDHFNISKFEVAGKKRTSELITPRHIVMYLSRQLTEAPLEKIGKVLGGKDHSTVDHGIKNIETKLSTDENLANTIDIIKKKISP